MQRENDASMLRHLSSSRISGGGDGGGSRKTKELQEIRSKIKQCVIQFYNQVVIPYLIHHMEEQECVLTMDYMYISAFYRTTTGNTMNKEDFEVFQRKFLHYLLDDEKRGFHSIEYHRKGKEKPQIMLCWKKEEEEVGGSSHFDSDETTLSPAF